MLRIFLHNMQAHNAAAGPEGPARAEPKVLSYLHICELTHKGKAFCAMNHNQIG